MALVGSGLAGAAILGFYRKTSPAPARLSLPTPAPSQEVAIDLAHSALPVPVLSASGAARVAVVPKPSPDRQTRHVESTMPLQRDVTFVIVPKGALVSIDDGPPEELFLKTKRLPVGVHAFRAEVPAPSKCCEVLRHQEEIKPDDGSGTPQNVSLSLNFRDAMISAPGAPKGAVLRCPVPRIAGEASKVFSVKMTTLEQDFSCDLEAPGVSTRQSSITLRAGELTVVPWSGP
jgi:hypothetical protein